MEPVPTGWKSERYAELPLVAEILRDFQVEVSLDAFADKGNYRFSRFWGKGSQITYAFTKNWAEQLATIYPQRRDGSVLLNGIEICRRKARQPLESKASSSRGIHS